MKILISGGTGLIGKLLKTHLEKNGAEVFLLSRGKGDFLWDIEKGWIDKDCVKNMDAIIHLAGAGIADKAWTASRKKELVDSRIKSAELIIEAIKTGNHSVKTFISASAIGYYGADCGERELGEEDLPGGDFVGNLTKDWEAAGKPIEDRGIRTAQIRIGLVLTKQGGFLEKVGRPIQWGLGACLGSGKQWQSWIHQEDLIQLFDFILHHPTAKGAFNAVAPAPVRQNILLKTLAKTIHRPFFLPNIPAFLLKIILGELSRVVLGSLKVSSKKIEGIGFKFKFTKIEEALEDLFKQ